MKKLFFSALFALSAIHSFAIPAKRVINSVSQADGTKLEIKKTGDETFHFCSTTDDMPLIATDRGYEYAIFKDGEMQSTHILAHNPSERTASESSFLLFNGKSNRSSVYTHWNERSIQRNSHRMSRSSKMRSLLASSQAKSRESGSEAITRKGLVILVNFNDVALAHTNADFTSMFNDNGYNKNRHIGSVRDYFIDQSNGQLTIDFDVVGPYTLSQSLNYYGENDSNGDDKHPGQMVAEACRMADADVNFKDYDWDGDGEVDQVYVIYASYGEASFSSSNGSKYVWPHEWGLQYSDYGSSLKLDGVVIDTYACSNELSGTSGNMMDGIGTACHEFSHCLGIPDLYDTSGDNFGMATWSIMDYGCYNGPSGYEGSVPAAYTAYERYFAGWTEPTELSDGCLVTSMPSITKNPESYIIFNEKNKDEYYILTNIQKESWNKYAEGHGLLIVHVDYDENAWYSNTVNNNAKHQRCTIIPADNDFGENDFWGSLAGDPYPGTSKNTSLTDTSTPAASLFNANNNGKYFMGKPIEEITENSDGTISFKFNGGPQLPVPEALEATDISETGFTAHWKNVTDAQSYTLELLEGYEAELTLVLTEDFNKLISSNLNTGTDISTSLDKYTSESGWSGTKLFPGSSNGVKLGSAKVQGKLTTPTISAPESGDITVYLKTVPYSTKNVSNFSVTVGNKTEEFTGDGDIVMNVSDVTSDFQVTVETGSVYRMYIKEIRVYDGKASAEELTATSKQRISAKRSVRVIEELTDTFYTFTDLTSVDYYYRAKSVNGPMESKWSNLIAVKLESQEQPRLRGDVNQDGKVDISDIVAIINTIAATEYTALADVNEDNTVDISDIVAVINIIAGQAS